MEIVLSLIFFISVIKDLSAVHDGNKDRIQEIPLDFNVALPVEASNMSITKHGSILACRVKRKAQEEKSEANYNIFSQKSPFDGNLCTHLIYGPLYVNTSYQLELEEECSPKKISEIKNISKKFPHLVIMLEVTYASNNNQLILLAKWDTQLHSEHLEFIESMKSSVVKCGFHGIFLEKAFYTARKGSFQYGDFLANRRRNRTEILALYLRDSFRKDGLLVAAEIELYPKWTIKFATKAVKPYILWLSHERISDLSHILDFVVVSGYQLRFRENNRSNYNAPLFAVEPEGFSIYDSLKTIIFDWGANPNTVILGVPFFGYYYLLQDPISEFGYNDTIYSEGIFSPLLNNRNYWGYNEVCHTILLNGNGWKMYCDNVAKVPFLKRNNHWITFDNSQSIAEKVSLAMELGLTGIMPHTIDTDDFHGNCSKIKHPLLKTINYSLKQSADKKNSLRCALYKNDSLTMYKPLVSIEYFIQRAPLNQTVIINCFAEGYGEVEINIVKDGKNFTFTNYVQNSEKHSCMTRVRTTVILKMEWISAGKYSCVANNTKGFAQQDFFLQIDNWPFLVADNDIRLQKVNMDFSIPEITTNMINHEQVLVCKVNRQEQLCRSGKCNSNYYDLTRVGELINGKLCTLIIYGPFLVNRKHEIIEEETKDFEAVKNFTETFPDVKILMEIKIHPNHLNSDELFQPTDSKRFSVFVRQYGFSGVHYESSFHCDEEDVSVCRKKNYVAIAHVVEQDFKKQGLMATTEIETFSKAAFKIIEDDIFLTNTFDFVFLKTFNFYKSSKVQKAFQNSPLEFFDKHNEDIKTNLEQILNRYKSGYCPILLGLQFFGYQYYLQKSEPHPFIFNDQPALLGMTLGYNDICSLVLSPKQNWSMFWDNKARIPFVNHGRKWITFDNPKSIYEKIRFYSSFVHKYKLQGFVVEYINNDDFLGNCSNMKYPLLRTVYQALNQKSANNNSKTANIEWWWISLMCFLAFISLVLTVGFIMVYNKTPTDGLTHKEIKEFVKGMYIISKKTNKIEENPDFLPYNTSFEISNDNFKIDEEEVLGAGAYGVVYKGEANGMAVAVKTVRPGADKIYLKSLLSELKILIHLGKHENIVNLVGASTTELKKGKVYIFVEFCPTGSLHDYLIRSRPFFEFQDISSTYILRSNEDETILTTYNLMSWCHQVAKGLQHLSEKKIIHGDLATRNILVFEKNTVKITDFGLSRKLYDYSVYVKKNEEPLPWRWMAIESLQDLQFSFQSDVWSFGITMWEIFSLGEVPYPGLSWTPDFVQLLKRNLRMQKPLHATDNMYSFMLECWREVPEQRPKPDELTEYFSFTVAP